MVEVTTTAAGVSSAGTVASIRLIDIDAPPEPPALSRAMLSGTGVAGPGADVAGSFTGSRGSVYHYLLGAPATEAMVQRIQAADQGLATLSESSDVGGGSGPDAGMIVPAVVVPVVVVGLVAAGMYMCWMAQRRAARRVRGFKEGGNVAAAGHSGGADPGPPVQSFTRLADARAQQEGQVPMDEPSPVQRTTQMVLLGGGRYSGHGLRGATSRQDRSAVAPLAAHNTD